MRPVGGGKRQIMHTKSQNEDDDATSSSSFPAIIGSAAAGHRRKTRRKNVPRSVGEKDEHPRPIHGSHDRQGTTVGPRPRQRQPQPSSSSRLTRDRRHLRESKHADKRQHAQHSKRQVMYRHQSKHSIIDNTNTCAGIRYANTEYKI